MNAAVLVAVLVLGLPVSAGMFGAFAWLGARYDTEPDTDQVPSDDLDTEPWPTPR